MKRKISLIVMALLLCMSAIAQSDFKSSWYYDSRYEVDDRPVSSPYPKYYYGQFIGYYQTWQRAEWHYASGGHSVYVWGYNGWQSQWYNGTYYWFTWANYERSVG
jgi:hypothetical protein